MNQHQLRSFGPILLYRVTDPVRERFIRVLTGMPIFGFAIGLSVKARLGVNPWTVFHEGLANRSPLTIGTATIATGFLLLVAFPLIGEPMGLGTLLNVVIIGTVTDLTIAWVPDLDSYAERILALAVSPMLIGLASGLYIGAGLGPGPRDGIMTALERRNIPVWAARTAIEATALLVGWLLGGTVGIGTVWMASSVGMFVHFFLGRLRIDPVG